MQTSIDQPTTKSLTTSEIGVDIKVNATSFELSPTRIPKPIQPAGDSDTDGLSKVSGPNCSDATRARRLAPTTTTTDEGRWIALPKQLCRAFLSGRPVCNRIPCKYFHGDEHALRAAREAGHNAYRPADGTTATKDHTEIEPKPSPNAPFGTPFHTPSHQLSLSGSYSAAATTTPRIAVCPAYYQGGTCKQGAGCPMIHSYPGYRTLDRDICSEFLASKCAKGKWCPLFHGTAEDKARLVREGADVYDSSTLTAVPHDKLLMDVRQSSAHSTPHSEASSGLTTPSITTTQQIPLNFAPPGLSVASAWLPQHPRPMPHSVIPYGGNVPPALNHAMTASYPMVQPPFELSNTQVQVPNHNIFPGQYMPFPAVMRGNPDYSQFVIPQTAIPYPFPPQAPTGGISATIPYGVDALLLQQHPGLQHLQPSSAAHLVRQHVAPGHLLQQQIPGMVPPAFVMHPPYLP